MNNLISCPHCSGLGVVASKKLDSFYEHFTRRYRHLKDLGLTEQEILEAMPVENKELDDLVRSGKAVKKCPMCKGRGKVFGSSVKDDSQSTIFDMEPPKRVFPQVRIEDVAGGF